MDAYDHVAQATIRSSALPLDTPIASGSVTPNPHPDGAAIPTTSQPSTTTSGPPSSTSEPGTLSTDLQEAYKSFSTSDWGTRLGGFFGSVRKSGESVISGVRNEASIASEEALKGFGELRREIVGIGNGVRKRGVSLVTGGESGGEKSVAAAASGSGSATATAAATEEQQGEDTEGFVARFRAEAERRLKDIQAAEDAADEALLRFGSNIRNFLRDAVTVSAPEEGSRDEGVGGLLFESKDADGKRVIHTSRFDAQMHVIHCSLDSFLKDPASGEYATWSAAFDVEKHTDDIAASLQKYEELRRAMEKLVPERVDYNTFWTRYYFLRLVVEGEEKRRKEMLKRAALNPEEEVGWDEDSDDEPGTPQAKSNTTLPTASTTLDTSEPRKSGDQHSQPDSDASYDLVSGATSQTPSSPKDEKEKEKEASKKPAGVTSETVKEDSDEEDWE